MASDSFTTGIDQSITAYSSNWTDPSSDFNVQASTDTAYASASGYSIAWYNAESFTNDQESSVTISARGSGAYTGVGVRLSGTSGNEYGYILYTDNGTCYFEKIVNGTVTEFGSATAPGVGVVLKLKIEGPTITPYYDGSTSGAPSGTTDSSITSGSAGLSTAFGSSSTRVDDFLGTSLGGGTYNLDLDTGSYTITGYDVDLVYETDKAHFVGGASGTSTGSSVSINKADISGLQDNDFVIVLVNKDDDAGGDYTAPSGWTITDHHSTTAGRDGRSAYAYKYITDVSSEPTSWTFSSTDTDEHSAVAAAFRNIDSTTPIATTTTVVTGTNDSTPDAPDITTGGNNEMVVSMLSLFDPQTPSYTGGSAPAELSTADFAVAQGADTSLSAIGYAYRETAGAFSIGSWTSGNSNTRAEYHVRTISLTEAAAGNSYSLDLNTGSYTVTGQSLDLVVNRKLDLDTGSYTVAGQDATLAANRVLSLDTGSYTTTGQDVELVVNRLLNLDTGSYSITGHDVTLQYNGAGGSYSLDLDTGAYSITGYAADLIVNRVLDLGLGSYDVTGQSADLVVSRVLSLDAGSYSVAGQNAKLVVSRVLELDTGSYTVTGYDVTLQYNSSAADYSMDLDTGSYSITGHNPDLVVNRVLNLDIGSYNTTGQPLDLVVGRVLNIETGSYNVTGQDVGMIVSRVMNLDTGSYIVTGRDLVINYSGEIIGSVVALTDSAAYRVVLTDSAAYVTELSDSAAYGVELSEAIA